jgi:dCTP deaminase
MTIDFPPGTLTDDDIIACARRGVLIVDKFESKNVKQACYELRASNIFFETSSPKENKRIVIDDGAYVLSPNNYVTVITAEKLAIPDNVVARILTKGALFSLGILPVNTYADPGFDGRLGITMYNFSRRYIAIRRDQAVAKIEFTVLPKSVKNPYSGQHGFETDIWPIPTHLYASLDDLRRRGIEPGTLDDLELRYGAPVADLQQKLNYYGSWIWAEVGMMLLFLVSIIALDKRFGLLAAIVGGVASNLLTRLFMVWIRDRRFKSHKTSYDAAEP